MTQTTIGQRIKFLIDSENISVRKFAQSLDVAETNVRNYIDKGTKPSSEALEKILRAFPRTNIAWLVLGEGDPFASNRPESSATQTGNFNVTGHGNKQTIKGNKGTIQSGSGNTVNNLTLDDCKRDLETAQREIEHLRSRLQDKEELLAAKDDTIRLLRAGHGQPNQ